MLKHLGGIVALTLLLTAAALLPFLPGGFDGLAPTLSSVAQLSALAAALLLAPIGVLWLIYEAWKGAAKASAAGDSNRSATDKGWCFALAAPAASALVAAVVALTASANMGLSLGVGVFVLWAFGAWGVLRGIRRLRDTPIGPFNPAPLYLACVPIAAALLQWSLLAPTVDFARTRAIERAAPMIAAIEEYQGVHGRYPQSLEACWKDYRPQVVGIQSYQYEANGDAYNLLFELPEWQFGTREVVMYNKLGEHAYASHDSHILRLGPGETRIRRGHYAVRDVPAHAHWRRFLFD